MNQFDWVEPAEAIEPPTRKVDKVDVMGIGINPLTLDELLRQIAGIIDRKERALVLNVNVHAYNLAFSQPWLVSLLNEAEIVFCDGAGVILGARLLGKRIPERITYADWYWQLASLAERKEYSFFLLGARPGVAAKAAEKLREKYPRLRIAGFRDGYFDMSAGSEDTATLIRQINAAAPDILTVGMGMPLQERWLRDNWDQLEAHIALTGGAVFDYISGELQRPPRWMTDNGLEWLGRMLIEPGRLWRRYLVGNPQFFWRVLKARFGASRQ